MITVQAINERLAKLQDGSLSLGDFEDWIVAESWDMHISSDAAAQRFVGAVEVRLAEFHQDHLSEHELLEELAEVPHLISIHYERVSFDGSVVIRHFVPEFYRTQTGNFSRHRHENWFRVSDSSVEGGAEGVAAPVEAYSSP
jgi:hypothetical protein